MPIYPKDLLNKRLNAEITLVFDRDNKKNPYRVVSVKSGTPRTYMRNTFGIDLDNLVSMMNVNEYQAEIITESEFRVLIIDYRTPMATELASNY
ncbi:hypothetical protein CEW46_21185 [Bacillus cereus]|nr:hypothetical protein CEW46_21185 [Bacillus cereus]